MLIVLIVILVLSGILYVFMQQPAFGKLPSGERLERIRESPNFRNNQFQNLNYTPALTEGASYIGVLKKFFFGKDKRGTPSDLIPSEKTDLLKLSANENILVWFGHSSYFLQLDGQKFLIDPVFSSNASPVTFTTKSFRGTNIYTPDDLPVIDCMFITHDHWDHLDYRTVVNLKQKIKKIITPLGVGSHLQHWGYKREAIIEKDWNEEENLGNGFGAYTIPARHFSGRGFKRNKTLWTSFILTTPSSKIFIGGDSGYDTHFKEAGEKFGPFDLAILENGQYNENWKYIHMMPAEVVQAAIDLKAKLLLPVHWSKFSLSLHAWDEPMIRLIKEAKNKGIRVIHPLIGETLNLKSPASGREWWIGLK